MRHLGLAETLLVQDREGKFWAHLIEVFEFVKWSNTALEFRG